MISKHETLHFFGIGSLTCLKLNLYEKITLPQGIHYAHFKNYPL